MKLNQKKISKMIEVSEPILSLILSGKREVSWPLAAKLSDLFPGKTIKQWKSATPHDLRKAFKLLDTERAA